jgi:hypothetical protein
VKLETLLLWALPVLIPLVGGLIGTALEALGAKYKIRALEGIGQRVEALFADLPKLIGGSRFTALKKELGTPADATVKEVVAQVKQDSVVPSRMFPSSPPHEKDPS